jgi:hypothetical protein
MKYMLLMYANEKDQPSDPEAYKSIAVAWQKYLKEIQAAGVLLANDGLLPTANASTLRVRNGKTLITDGPFAETHEQLAGYSVIECKDIDEALSWAAKVPFAVYGSVEVRPVWSNQ